ncbi:MAG: hypothetical protein ACRCTJ_03460 [Brevinema sp.]
MIEQIDNMIRERIRQKSFPVLAKISKIYQSKDKYFVDCIELSNEEEETNTTLTRVPLPKYWGTKKGGIWMTPSIGAKALVSFLNGDKNFPIITNILGSDHEEAHQEDSLLIKIGDISITMNETQITLKANSQEIVISDKITISNNMTTLKSILEDIVDDLPQVVCPNGGPSTVTPSFNSISIKNKISLLMS